MSESTASPPPTHKADLPTSHEEPRHYSAATVRKAIIQVLATTDARTPREIEAAVGKLLPSPSRASAMEQLAALSESDYVRIVPGKPRQVELSDSGQKWWVGIQALTPAA
jgi:hypothetical protein